jgi:hypothetical protein
MLENYGTDIWRGGKEMGLRASQWEMAPLKGKLNNRVGNKVPSTGNFLPHYMVPIPENSNLQISHINFKILPTAKKQQKTKLQPQHSPVILIHVIISTPLQSFRAKGQGAVVL